MTEARDVNFGVEVSSGIVAKMVMAVIGFAGTVVFARVLGPTSFGAFYVVLALVKVADRPIAGVAQAVKKRFSEGDANREALLGSGFILYGSISLLGVLASAVAGRGLSNYAGVEEAGTMFAVMLVSLGLFILTQRVLAATGMVGKTAWIDMLRSLLTFPFQLAFVLAGFGAAGMAYGLSAATLLVVPLTLFLLKVVPSVPSAESVRSVYEFAVYSIPNSLVLRTYRQFDTLVLAFLLAPAAAGHYEVAFKLTMPAMYVSAMISTGLMPRVSNLESVDESIVEDVTNSFAFASILAVPVFFGALAIPKQIVVTFYGAEYREAAVLLMGLALFRLLYTQSRVMLATIEGLDRPDWTMKVNTATLLVNVLLGYLLILEMGAVGVVVATVVAEAVRYLGNAWFLRRLSGIEFFPSLLRRQFAAGLVMYASVEGLHLVMGVDSWVALAVFLGVGAATYFSVLGAVSEQFRHTVVAVTEPVVP